MINIDDGNTKTNVYDDGNIPEIDTPKPDNATNTFPPEFGNSNIIPKDESTRPRKDGPGGN